jgi:hypothetical protein
VKRAAFAGVALILGDVHTLSLHAPIVGSCAMPSGQGYNMVAADGGVFAFNAPFGGSLARLSLRQPIVAIARYGNAYLMAAADGGVFNFSKRPFFGSAAGLSASPVVGAAAVG